MDAADATFILQTCLRAERRLDDETARELALRGLAWLTRFKDSANADYVFNPLLRSARLQEDIWSKVADIAVNWLVESRSPAVKMRALNSLLMRHEWHPKARRDSLIGQALKLVRDASPQGRDRFLLGTLMRIGPPQVQVEELLALRDESDVSTPRSSFQSLTDQLRRLVRIQHGETPDSGFFVDAFRRVEEQRLRSPASAAYAIGPLTIMTQGTELLPQVIALARTILGDSRLPPRARGGIAGDLSRLAKMNGLEPAVLANILAELGLYEHTTKVN